MDSNLSKIYTLLISLLIISILLLSLTIFYVGKNLGELSECNATKEFAQDWFLSIEILGPKDKELRDNLKNIINETKCNYGEIKYSD